MAKARIKLSSTDPVLLDEICNQIKDIANKTGVAMSGPIPLPTKHLKIPVRRSPCGAGRETYETYEMKIRKRLIDLGVNERTLRLIMRVPIPKGVNIQIEVIE